MVRGFSEGGIGFDGSFAWEKAVMGSDRVCAVCGPCAGLTGVKEQVCAEVERNQRIHLFPNAKEKGG